MTAPDKDNSRGQFFPFSVLVARRIVAQGGGAAEVGAYLTLSRGAGRYSATRWTENAVSERLGVTYSVAQRACSWLAEHGFLVRTDAAVAASDEHPPSDRQVNMSEGRPESCGHQNAKSRWRVVRPSEGDVVYLPNSLLDGIGSGKAIPPIRRLFTGIQIDTAAGITAGKARLDALMALLSLYSMNDLSRYGGVAPTVWRHEWQLSLNQGESVRCLLPEAGLVLVEIERGAGSTSDQSAIDAILCHVDESAERAIRFHLALKNIREAGLVYEVLEVWSADPATDADAEVLYPLYIFDASARENGTEPSLSRVVNSVAIKAYSEEFGHDVVFDHEGTFLLCDGAKYRFVEHADHPACPVSVLRLRFRASDRETGIGFGEQHRQVAEWERLLEIARAAL